MTLTPELIIEAYCRGLFPMAQARGAQDIHWYDPPERGVLPIAELHVPHRLARTVKQGRYKITFDCAFEDVILNCAEARGETWINAEIQSVYTALYRMGVAHSVEAWAVKDGRAVLAGGLYGLALGGAFFGESMFSFATDASKTALVHLAARLWRQGFSLLDAQFMNEHLLQFGIEAVPRAEYHRRLRAALAQPASFLRNETQGDFCPPASSSNEPGSFSNAAGGKACAGAEAFGAGTMGLSAGATSVAGLGAGAEGGGMAAGAGSGEKVDASLAEVVAFLQSRTQTS